MQQNLTHNQIILRSLKQIHLIEQDKNIDLLFQKDLFVGEKGASIISNFIEQHQQLESLKLVFSQNNNLSSQGLSNISRSISKYINIIDLSIEIQGLNQIDFSGFKALGEIFEKLKILKSFSFCIYRNCVQDGIQFLMDGIKTSINLEKLNLSFKRNVNLGSSFMKKVEIALQFLTNLKQLSMSLGWQSKIGKEGAQSLGGILQNLKKLEFLEINIGSDNIITGDGLNYISQGLRLLTKLKYLNIFIGYQNQIDDDSLKNLGLVVTQLDLLNEANIQLKSELSSKYLKFGCGFYYFNKKNINFKIEINNVDLIQMFRLSEGLMYNNQLQNLQLRIKNLNDCKDLEQLFMRSFQGLKNLQYLDLLISTNFTSLKYIGKCFPQLLSLKSLKLKFQIKKNANTLQDVQLLQMGIQQLTQLQILKLDFRAENLISLVGLKCILQAVQQLTQLNAFKLDVRIDKFETKENLDLIQYLTDLKYLNKLSVRYLGNEKIQKSYLQVLNQPFNQLKNLKSLKLILEQSSEYLNFCLKQLGCVLKEIQLESLKLSFGGNNMINSDSVQSFSEGLAHQKSLKNLSLTFKDDICSQSIIYLGQALVNLKNMENLNFVCEKSQIGFTGIESLHSSLKNLVRIQKIKLQFTDLASIFLLSLIQALPLVNSKTFYLSCLPSLYFQKNIQDSSVQSICLEIQNKQVDVQNLFKSVTFFTNLKRFYFNLKDSLIDDNIINMFGQTLNSLVGLTELKFKLNGKNKINEKGALIINEGISKQKNLKQLYIQIGKENNLDINGARMIAESVKSLNNLENLEFKINENNQFFSECLIDLSDGIKNNIYLKFLKIKIMKGNTINSEAIQSFADALNNLNNLQQLIFQVDQNLQLNLECFKAFIENLKSKQKVLKLLQININSPYKCFFITLLQEFNNLTDDDYFQEYFQIKEINSINQQITELDISFQFHKEQILYIQGFSAGLETFSNLEILKLQFKSKVLDLESSSFLGNALNSLRNLKVLNLQFQEDNLDSERSIRIFEALKDLNQLNDLSIQIHQQNKIGEQGAFVLGQSIKNLTKISNLNLHIGKANNIQSRGFQSIADSLTYLNQLKSINFKICEQNHIGYSSVQTIKDNIKKLKSLDSVSILIDEASTILFLSFLEDTLNIHFSFENSCIKDLKYLKKDDKLVQLSICVQKINLGVEGAFYFSENLKTFNQLKQLSLIIQQNNLGQQGAAYIGEALQCLNSIKQLSIQIDNNNIQCYGAQKISNGIGYLINLKELSLIYEFDNNIKQLGGISIGNCLVNLKKLTHLKIKISKGNNIKEEGGYEIGQSLRNLTNLVEFDIELHSDNSICLKGVKSIVDALVYLQQIQQKIKINNQNQLKLIKFDIGDKANIYLLYLITNNLLKTQIIQNCIPDIQFKSEIIEKQFVVLNLSLQLSKKYQIKQQGVEALGEVLKQTNNLKNLFLDLQCNSIEAQGADGLSKGIQTLNQLKSLTLYIADFAGIHSKGLSSLSLSIGKLQNLEQLKLVIGRTNNIDEAGGIDLGIGLSNLRQLQELHLQIDSYNDIQITGSKYVFDGIKNLKKLKKLSLQVESYASLIYLLLLNELPLILSQNLQLKYFENIHFERENGTISQLSFSINQYYFDQVQGCIEFCKGLASFTNLKQITYLSNSQGISKVSIIELSKSISFMTHLQKIEFKFNENNIIEDVGIINLSKAIISLKNIKYAVFEIGRKSQIKREGYSKLIESIYNFKELQSLRFTIQRDNEFTFENVFNLAESIENSNCLSDLQIKIDSPKNDLLNLQQILDINLSKLINLKNFTFKIINLQELKSLKSNKMFIETLPLLQNIICLQLHIDSKDSLGKDGIKNLRSFAIIKL
ncbi:hypothetical protein ABPG74_006027 [Tetrahymena malaccensis]